jgi:hypothetical protein
MWGEDGIGTRPIKLKLGYAGSSYHVKKNRFNRGSDNHFQNHKTIIAARAQITSVCDEVYLYLDFCSRLATWTFFLRCLVVGT